MRIIALILILGIAPPLATQAAENAAAASIRALEREWTEGQSRKDNRILDLIFDDALVYVEYGNLVSKAAYLARIRTDVPSSDQISMGPMSVRTYGTTAIVVGTYTEKQGKGSPPTLKSWRFIDTWVYEKSGWVLVAAAAAPMAQ
jgi:ketosteroid isomerase-like protein